MMHRTQFGQSGAPALIVPSRPNKKFCRTVEVSADSPNVLCPHAARMGDESKAAGRSHARRLCCLNFLGGLSGALRFLLRNNILLGK
jgi:hypothetical protein